jgi:stage V sporulation protein B
MPLTHSTSSNTAPQESHGWKSTPLASGGALVAAKVVFVISGYAIFAGLSRLLPAAEFGTYLVVNSTVGVLNAIFVTGTIQAVSRFVAQRAEGAGATLRAALRLQFLLAGSVSAAYCLLAPALSSLLHDPLLTPYLRVSAVIPVAYAFYAAIIGYLNGGRQFASQAGFDMSFSFLKVVLVLALPALGYGAFGAVSGFAAAAVLVLVVAWGTVGARAVRQPGSSVSSSEILRYEGTVMAYVALTNLLMQIDLLMVKAFSEAAAASSATAMYGAAAKLAQIPQSFLVALNFLIFPYIARSTAQSSKSETAYCIRQAVRVGAALVVGPAVVLAAVSPQSVTFVFGSAYASAAPSLATLACGYVAFSLFTLTATIINSAGRPAVSLLLAAATLSAQVAMAWTLIPSYGILGGAVASSLAYALGLIAASTYLVAQFGSVLPWASLGRIANAIGVVAAVSRTSLGQYP